MSLARAALSESKSKTLTKSQRNSLAKETDFATAAFKKLYAESDKFSKALATAKTHLSDLKSIAKDASSSVKGTFDLTGGLGQTDANGYTVPVTASSLLATGKSEATQAAAFASGLSKMQKKLGSGAAAYQITQQALSAFASDPAQGIEFVKAINSMSASQASTLKGDYSSISASGTKVGTTTADADSKGGIAAANRAANDLSKSLDKVTKSIGNIGTSLDNAMLRPYGLKLNGAGKVVKRASGGWVTGAGTSTSDSIHLAASNGEFVVNAKAASANAALLQRINSTSTYTGPVSTGGPSMSVSAAVNVLASAMASMPVTVAATIAPSSRDQARLFIGGANEAIRESHPIVRKLANA
jgi:hypothetical protein